MCWILGSAPAYGPSRPWDGRRKRRSWRCFILPVWCRIPDLIAEIPRRLQTLRLETQIIARRIACNQHKPQRISAILLNHLQRVIEIVKPRLYGKETEVSRRTAQQVIAAVLRDTMILLHPFMPFITEEICIPDKIIQRIGCAAQIITLQTVGHILSDRMETADTASEEELSIARRRLVFEELFLLAIGLRRLRGRRDQLTCAPWGDTDLTAFLEQLPFRLSSDARMLLRSFALTAPVSSAVWTPNFSSSGASPL